MIKNGLISGSIVKTKISDFCLDNWATINVSLRDKNYMGSNKNKGYEYDADRLYSSQKDKENQLRLEKENQRQQLGNK